MYILVVDFYWVDFDGEYSYLRKKKIQRLEL